MTRESSTAEPEAVEGMGLLDELLAAPVIRPGAVARGRALVDAAGSCPADALASQLLDDLVHEADTAGTPGERVPEA
jgi:hypothetical protein